MNMPFFKNLYKEIYSDETLNEAWRKVRNNGETPGVDGVTLNQFGGSLFLNMKKLQRDLKKGNYGPQAVRSFNLRKPDGGMRPISILTIRDRLVHRAVLQVIEPLFERIFLPCSYAFRKGKSTKMAAEEARGTIKKGFFWVVDLDVHNFFPSINRKKLYCLLKARVKDRKIRRMLQGWIFYETERSLLPFRRQANGHGILQGSPLSPLFGNLYLHPFDQKVTAKGMKMVRYADNILLFCQSLKKAEKSQKVLEKLLSKYDLSINRRKTRIVMARREITFLGERLSA